MKILITGGHLTPALSIIDEIHKRDRKHLISLLFVGRKYALDSEKTYSLEYKEVTNRHIPFISLQAGRLTRFISIKSIVNVLKIPLGFFQAWKIIRNEKPDVILSFGSYLALPVVLWAFVFKIPVYTHEQTIHPGLANKIIGFFAKKIFVAFKESCIFFNSKKTNITGNPIRESIFQIQNKPFEIMKNRPVVYVTGGSLGSHSINEHIAKLIKKLLTRYIVVHQVGETKEYHDYENLLKIKKVLPANIRDRYFIKEHFFESEIGYIYSLADIIVGRAGANTFFELVALKKPAIFIPLPWSANAEQQKHAEIFEKAGAGKTFNQYEDSEKLLLMIDEMIKNKEKYKKNFRSLTHLYNHNAAEFIVSEILPEIQ